MKTFTSENLKAFVSTPLFDKAILLNRVSTSTKISIVTPSYNQAKYLERTILSVLNQNYPNLEYIIIDGGSSDGSVEIIRKYEKYLAYWTTEQDTGQSDAINKGFLKSSGEILAWLNSDDTYLPDTLQTVASCFRKHPDMDVLCGDIYVVDDDDSILRAVKEVSFNRKALIYGAHNINQQATFWKRDLFHKTGGLKTDLHYCMDVYLLLTFVKLAARFRHIPAFLANYRQHVQSKSSCKTEQFMREFTLLRRELFNLDVNSVKFRLLRSFYYLRRLFLFFFRLDLSYLLSGLMRRIVLLNKNNLA